MTRTVPSSLLVSLFAVLLAGCLAGPAESKPLTLSEALLWSSTYPDLTLQIAFVEGARPTDRALDALVQTIRDVTGRTHVEVEGPMPIHGAKGDPARKWSPNSLDEFLEHRFPDPPRWRGAGPILQVIYVDGEMHDRDRLIYGRSWGYDIVMLPHGFRADVPVPEEARIERSVLIHEFGHSLGLVGCGVPMIVPHGEEGCHSSNEESVMHRDIDTDVPHRLLDLAQEGAWIPYKFDETDLRDLRAFQARETRP